MNFKNIFRIERDSDGETLFIFFDDFRFLKKANFYDKLKKIDRCYRRFKKICKDPKLNIEYPKPSIHRALEAVQSSYDEGIGYAYTFDEYDLNTYIYPNVRRDLIVNAKLVYYDKQDSRDKFYLREKIIEIYNEDNDYLSRITLLYNYIIRQKDNLYDMLFNEVIHSDTRLSFQLIWLSYDILDIQDYKRIISRVFKNSSDSEKELLKMFLESRIGKYKDNPRFLKAQDTDESKIEMAKQLLEDIWYSRNL